MWDVTASGVYADRAGEVDAEKNYPIWFAWHNCVKERAAIKKVIEEKAALAKH